MLVSCFEISKDLIRHQITLFMLCLTSQKPCVWLMEGVHYLTNYSPNMHSCPVRGVYGSRIDLIRHLKTHKTQDHAH